MLRHIIIVSLCELFLVAAMLSNSCALQSSLYPDFLVVSTRLRNVLVWVDSVSLSAAAARMRQRDKSTADLFQRQLLKSENRNQKKKTENRK